MADVVPDTWLNQTTEIVAVLATIVAALTALSGAYASIESAEKARQSERRAKLEASISTLPLVLSQVTTVADNRVLVLISGNSAKPQNSWNLDETSLQVFKECIEFSDQEVAGLLQEILAAYQICIARYENCDNNLPIDDPLLSFYDKYHRYSQCADWLSFRFLAENLFPFSRNRQRPAGRDEVFVKTQRELGWLSLNGFMLSNDPDFQNYLENVSNRGKAGFSDPNWRWN